MASVPMLIELKNPPNSHNKGVEKPIADCPATA